MLDLKKLMASFDGQQYMEASLAFKRASMGVTIDNGASQILDAAPKPTAPNPAL